MPTVHKNAPKYCLHTPSGRAYVRIRGRVCYCGKHGTPESLAEYARLVAEMAATPATLPARRLVTRPHHRGIGRRLLRILQRILPPEGRDAQRLA